MFFKGGIKSYHLYFTLVRTIICAGEGDCFSPEQAVNSTLFPITALSIYELFLLKYNINDFWLLFQTFVISNRYDDYQIPYTYEWSQTSAVYYIYFYRNTYMYLLHDSFVIHRVHVHVFLQYTRVFMLQSVTLLLKRVDHSNSRANFLTFICIHIKPILIILKSINAEDDCLLQWCFI